MNYPKISISTLEAEDKLPIGSSKFFGNPDMWHGFDWPEYLDSDGNYYCMDFICQINCADLAEFDINSAFPKTGMLYFFYALDDTPFALKKSSPVCYYYSGDIKELDELVLMFDDGSLAQTKEQKIEFSIDSTARYPDHHLLGEPSISLFDSDAQGLGNMILLFEMYGFETSDRNIYFWDDGTLQFYVDPEKLKVGDVSSVEVRLNTT